MGTLFSRCAKSSDSVTTESTTTSTPAPAPRPVDAAALPPRQTSVPVPAALSQSSPPRPQQQQEQQQQQQYHELTTVPESAPAPGARTPERRDSLSSEDSFGRERWLPGARRTPGSVMGVLGP